MPIYLLRIKYDYFGNLDACLGTATEWSKSLFEVINILSYQLIVYLDHEKKKLSYESK